MTVKRVRLPKSLLYPVRVTQVHVSAGEQVTKGAPLYTLETASGKEGTMKCPAVGVLVEGPVPVGASFEASVPVAGIEIRSEAVKPEPKPAPSPAPKPQPAPEPEAPPKPEKTKATLEEDFEAILQEAPVLAQNVGFDYFQTLIQHKLIARGHSTATADTKLSDPRLRFIWTETKGHSPEPVPPQEPKPSASETPEKQNDIAEASVPPEPERATTPPQMGETRNGFAIGLGIICLLILGAATFWVAAIARFSVPQDYGILAGLGATIVYLFVVLISANLVLPPMPGLALTIFGIACLLGSAATVLPDSVVRNLTSTERVFGGLFAPASPIAEGLGLPSIASFSNGQVPKPSARQQSDFERFISQ